MQPHVQVQAQITQVPQVQVTQSVQQIQVQSPPSSTQPQQTFNK